MMMTIPALLLCALIVAPPSPEVRIETLRFQLERVAAIEVEPDARADRDARLAELAAQIAAASEAAATADLDAIYDRLDAVRDELLKRAVPRPVMPAGGFADEDDAWVVDTPALRLRVQKSDLAMEVKTAENTWHFLPSGATDVELLDGTRASLAAARVKSATAFPTGYSVGMVITLADLPALPNATLLLQAHLTGNEILFELVAPGDIAGLDAVHWPFPLATDNTAAHTAVIPWMQGILLPGDWQQPLYRQDLVHSRTLYMPWWGQLRGNAGVLTIIETADDAGAAYRHPPGGPTRFQPRWYASMGALRYPRQIRYVFDDATGYVAMAKRYRRYVQETGRFVTLEEKMARTPNLRRVVGNPVFHIGALYHTVPGSRFYSAAQRESNHGLTTFDQLAQALRESKESGIDTAYVHLDGWGFRGYDNAHPDVVPPGPEQGGIEGLRRLADVCDELGYLLALHDNYRDFYFNAVSFGAHLALTRADGSREEHAEWAGGRQTYLSPRFAPDYVRRNHDFFQAHDIKIKGAYLDVFAVVPLEESYQPAHPITRTDCARYRRECFDILRARGYVVSSEEPADYLINSIDLVHHGPYPVYPKGYGQGEVWGIPVPLFNLVYHDSILLPWPMSEDGGWGIPKGDAGRLHCLLNAGLPYARLGRQHPEDAALHEALAVARKVGTLEMTNHEFLREDRRLQRATYADGTRITVDFDAKTYMIESP